ncbi:MAG: patatin, partial [Proteobacteria bacterium]|nr:patatin [Pseudomonadota bacterium]
FVIAVDLNEFRNRKNNKEKKDRPGAGKGNFSASIASTSPVGVNTGTNRLINELNKRLAVLRLAASQQFKQLLNRDDRPNIYEVLAASINIIESRITAARLVESPPDLLIRPKLAHIHLLGFDRAEEAIDRGYQAAMASLKSFVP